jgi:branched-chain amino acid transport system ATP-binding protein
MTETLTNSAPSSPNKGALLSANGLGAGYGKLRVIQNIDLHVGQGEAVGIIGHNGAGKTTLLRAIFGNIRPFGGSITFDGTTRKSADCRNSIRRGMAYVVADHYTFAALTVRENLKIAQLNAATGHKASLALEEAEALFPIIGQRMDQLASTLSGGERRMLGIAMSLMWSPRLLLLDEPSLGLAPAAADRVFAALRHLAEEKNVSILCVEQSVPQLLSLVQRIYVMRSGQIDSEKTSDELSHEEDLWRYF